MKVVFVSGALRCGGAERVTCILANNFALHGHDVTITIVANTSESFFELNEKVKILPILKGLVRFKKIRGLLRLRSYYKSLKPDIIISFQDRTNILALLSHTALSTPIIISERNHPQYKPISKVLGFLKSILYPKSDHLVVQTRSICEWFIDQGFNAEKISIIKNPLADIKIDLDFTHPTRKYIVTCGRLVQQKGFKELIEIFARLAEDYPNWDLRIVGDGKYRETLAKKISDLNLTDRVFLEGYKKNPLNIVSAGEIFTLTSHYEGFPNSLAEAMACGKAVISFDCPSGPADMIENNVNGILVKNGDKNSFLENLAVLMRDEKLRKSLGHEAQKIKESLSTERISKDWNDLILKTIEG